MNAKGLIEKCPFRDDSASKAIYVTIARSPKPMSVEDIWRKSKVPLGKVKTLVASFFNVMHNAPLRRIGIALIRDKNGHVSLTTCKADPKAKRPERGQRKSKKAAKKTAQRKPNAKKAASKPSPKPEPVKPTGESPAPAPIAPKAE